MEAMEKTPKIHFFRAKVMRESKTSSILFGVEEEDLRHFSGAGFFFLVGRLWRLTEVFFKSI